MKLVKSYNINIFTSISPFPLLSKSPISAALEYKVCWIQNSFSFSQFPSLCYYSLKLDFPTERGKNVMVGDRNILTSVTKNTRLMWLVRKKSFFTYEIGLQQIIWYYEICALIFQIFWENSEGSNSLTLNDKVCGWKKCKKFGCLSNWQKSISYHAWK